MSRRQRGYPWPSLAISPYHSSPPAGLQGYILCPHIVAVCMFVLVVPLLHIHMWGSTGVHRLWARPCFSSSTNQTRTCTVYQKEKEIIEVKHKRNVSFLEAWRIVGSYMGESSYASVARKANRTNDDTKYRTLVEKLLKLEANDWPKFQEHLKKLHSDEFYQAPAQQQVANGERSNVVVQTKTHIGSITPTRTTPKSAKSPSKQPLHKSPIRPPKSIKDRQKNLSPMGPEQLK